MKKDDAKLIDLALRETLRPWHGWEPGGPRPRGGWVPQQARAKLLQARKFVLDQQMSAFLADLSNASLMGVRGDRLREIVNGARLQARLPHKVCWFEYDNRARKRRAYEAYPDIQFPKRAAEEIPVEDLIHRLGWLLEESADANACRLTEIAEQEGRAIMMPYSYTWVVDDQTALPWRNLPWANEGQQPSAMASGIMNWVSDKAGVAASMAMTPKLTSKNLETLLREGVGELRVAWTLLATLNDLPTTVEMVRPSKGYVARGSYRKFVEHSIITLKVPAHRSLQTLAARAVAVVRRRAHEVRGHYREDWRVPLRKSCPHDEWESAGERRLRCVMCRGEKFWINEHQRGDASLGFVTHEYSVQKGEENATTTRGERHRLPQAGDGASA